ncbi:MAG: hypothetical protein JWR80_4951 [Bradyrhizobium sp.]|nr:hypothetical protein [Bradyrhizobium sp.]
MWIAEVLSSWIFQLISWMFSIFDDLIHIVGYTVARFILPLLSFGKVYVEPLTTPQKRFNALGYRYDDSGRIEISETIAGFIGFILFLTAFFVVYLLIQSVV